MFDLFVTLIQYIGKGRARINWKRSVFRHPVFVYCTELDAFLKKCEDFHYQITGDMIRLRSKKALARSFFRKVLSTDPHDKDPRYEENGVKFK